MSETDPTLPVVVIVGPTGIGKTALSLALAERHPVEIVSADSRQVYRYLDIGTAKPTPAEREAAPHHFIDIRDPDDFYSAGQYMQEARAAIGEIRNRGARPVVVGGSGLYVRALLQGFFQEDVRDGGIRDELRGRLERDGAEALHAELYALDPEAAARIHPNNTPRLIRALEVSLAAGRPISELQAEKRDPAPFPWKMFGLIMDREQLNRRINRRVREMIELGLVAEVEGVLARGFPPDLNALNSVGYAEVIAHLNGEYDLARCIEQIKRNSRRYAKRQLTWFRREPDIRWLDMDAGPEAALAVIEREAFPAPERP